MDKFINGVIILYVVVIYYIFLEKVSNFIGGDSWQQLCLVIIFVILLSYLNGSIYEKFKNNLKQNKN